MTVRTIALALGDAVVLVCVRPRWTSLAVGLSRPRGWLDRAGADVATAAVCTALLWLAAAWIAIGLLAGLGVRLPGAAGRACRRGARIVLPSVLLRLVIGTAGLGLLAAPAAQAVAPGHPAGDLTARGGPVSVSRWAGPEVPSPTWPVTPAPTGTPTRIPAPAPPTSTPRTPAPAPRTPVTPAPRPPVSTPPVTPSRATPTPATPAPAARSHVHRGDSLWLLAAHRLGPHATAGDVADYWHRIYAANRSVIGDDPAVIHPGQVLDLPTPTTQESS